jgi:hypothetical protein
MEVGGQKQNTSQNSTTKTADNWGIRDLLMNNPAGEFANKEIIRSALDPTADTSFNDSMRTQLGEGIAQAHSGDQFQSMGAASRGAAESRAVVGHEANLINALQGASNADTAYRLGTTAAAQPYQGTTTKGTGTSSGTQGQAGITCCFIILEGLNGELPWFVRHYRDIYHNIMPDMVKGYRRLSRWLVPAMRTWSPVKNLVNKLMVKPLVRIGAGMAGVEPTLFWHKPVRVFYGYLFIALGKL